MNRIHSVFSFFFMSLMGLILFSCADDYPVVYIPDGESNDMITIEIQPSIFGQKGGEDTLTFSASSNWTASSSVDWISLSMSGGGKGRNTIQVKVGKNKSLDERKGSITLMCGKALESVEIVQEGLDMTKLDFMSFTALDDNCSFGFNVKDGHEPLLSYSFDKLEWEEWDFSSIDLEKFQTVYLKGFNEKGFASDSESDNYFTTVGDLAADGNIMSLLYGEWFEDETAVPYKAFPYLFHNTTIRKAPKLPATELNYSAYSLMFAGCEFLEMAPELPAATLAANCYYGMFNNCVSLIESPKLPAEVLAPGCYSYMFAGCNNLIIAPELPVDQLEKDCYKYMFVGCSSLTAPPALPAKNLAESCYESMFVGCSGLTEGPELPATELQKNCYKQMFSMCSKLSSVKVAFTEIEDKNWLGDWLALTSFKGTLYNSPDASWSKEDVCLPEFWEIVSY